jgi:S1-C subfamily serine protease
VSDDGLIMLSSSGIDAARRRLQPRRGRDGGEGMQIQSTPEELRVMLDGGTDEHEAELIAQDDTLGLVFVRVLDPSVLSTTNPISFSTPEQMRVGEELIGVNRLSKAYDSAPVLGWTRVTGRITQPRTMWAIGPGFSAGGLPLFNRYGQAVGVLSTQTPQSQDADTGRGGPDGGDRLFLIPATDVNAAIEQARQKMKANTKADAQPATQEGS